MIGNDIELASRYLSDGKLVAFATETVYGLGANALCNDAVASIYNVKKRPSFNPLIIHSYSISQLEKYVVFEERAKRFAEKFWPGPLTLVLPRRNDSISSIASCGLDTLAVRIPNHPIALNLLEKCNLPIAAPSANMSGKVSPSRASDVESEIGNQIAYILDGGDCNVGIESTVLSLAGEFPTILRPGVITIDMLREISPDVRFMSESDKVENIIAPGMLAKHYSPSLGVELNVTTSRIGYAFIGFGKMDFAVDINLSETGNLNQAAANLFRALRDLDDSEKYKGILVSKIPSDGVGYAINDRLRRAAAKD